MSTATASDPLPTPSVPQRGCGALYDDVARLVAAHPDMRAYAFEESGRWGVCLYRAGRTVDMTIDLPVRFSRPAAAVRLVRLVNGDLP